MKRSTLINLVFYGVALAVFIVCLVLNFTPYGEEDIFGTLFYSSIALVLSGALQLKRMLLSASDEKPSPVLLTVLNIVGGIGSAVFIVAFAFGTFSVAENISDYHDYILKAESRQSCDLMCIGFAYIASAVLGSFLRTIDRWLPVNPDEWRYEFFDNYAFVILFPLTLVISYILSFVTVLPLIILFFLNYVAIVVFIKLRQLADGDGGVLCLVLSYLYLFVIAAANLFITMSMGLDGTITEEFSRVLYTSTSMYFFIAAILGVLYTVIDRISKGFAPWFEKLFFLLLPLLCYIIQVLMCYFWQVALGAVLLVVGVLFVVGFFYSTLESSGTPSYQGGYDEPSPPTPIGDLDLDVKAALDGMSYIEDYQLEAYLGHVGRIHLYLNSHNESRVKGELARAGIDLPVVLHFTN